MGCSLHSARLHAYFCGIVRVFACGEGKLGVREKKNPASGKTCRIVCRMFQDVFWALLPMFVRVP